MNASTEKRRGEAYTSESKQVVGILLGAPNTEEGALSDLARARAEMLLNLMQRNPAMRAILTGGRGAHFNVSNRPHFSWVARYLARRGSDMNRIIGGVFSSNTVEDAGFSMSLLHRYDGIVMIITSSFHTKRAEFIFRCMMPSRKICVVGAEDCLSREALQQAIVHEERALFYLRSQGGVSFSGKLWPAYKEP